MTTSSSPAPADAISDCNACRKYGRFALLLAAVILLPPIVVDLALTLTHNTVMGVGIFHGLLIDHKDHVPGTWSLGRYRDVFPYTLAGLAIAATICTVFGLVILRLANKAQADAARSAQIRRKCRLLLLTLMFLPIGFFVLAIVLAIAGHEQLLGLHFASLLLLYLMESWIVVPHLLAVLVLWGTGFALACGLFEKDERLRGTA